MGTLQQQTLLFQLSDKESHPVYLHYTWLYLVDYVDLSPCYCKPQNMWLNAGDFVVLHTQNWAIEYGTIVGLMMSPVNSLQ
jgi:hypothetical protein